MIVELIKTKKYQDLFNHVYNLKKYKKYDNKKIENKSGIYFLWRGDVITYIGISQEIYNRIYDSRTPHIHSKDFDFVSFEEIDMNNRSLEEYEYTLISLFNPRDNSANRGFTLYEYLPTEYKEHKEKKGWEEAERDAMIMMKAMQDAFGGIRIPIKR
jgi:hypothetical protein